MIFVCGFDCETLRGDFDAGASGFWKSTKMGLALHLPYVALVVIVHEAAYALPGLLCT